MVNFSKNLEEMGSLKRMSRNRLRKSISLQIHHISDRIPEDEMKDFLPMVWVGFVMSLQ